MFSQHAGDAGKRDTIAVAVQQPEVLEHRHGDLQGPGVNGQFGERSRTIGECVKEAKLMPRRDHGKRLGRPQQRVDVALGAYRIHNPYVGRKDSARQPACNWFGILAAGIDARGHIMATRVELTDRQNRDL